MVKKIIPLQGPGQLFLLAVRIAPEVLGPAGKDGRLHDSPTERVTV